MAKSNQNRLRIVPPLESASGRIDAADPTDEGDAVGEAIDAILEAHRKEVISTEIATAAIDDVFKRELETLS